MTDKQIIIDGVDVSGCIYYDANADKESYFLHDCKKEHAPCWSCSSMPSCIYKKYKRKEQECEELKNEYWKLEQGNDFLAEKNSKLKGCLTEIKEIAQVNSINTCWTAINLCADCDDIKECGLQSPFEKLKAIIQIISECEGNND